MSVVDIPKEVSELIARFEQNIDSYQSQAYNETQVRLEFINPFFEALGWDVANIIPIHRGLISLYTAGLAAFAGMNALDKFFVNAEYCFRFSFCHIDKP